MTTEPEPPAPDAENGPVYPHAPTPRALPTGPVLVERPKPAATSFALGIVGTILALVLFLGGSAARASAGLYSGTSGADFAMTAGALLGIAALASLAIGVFRLVAAVDVIAAERYNSTLDRR